MKKIVEVQEAVATIPDGATVVIGGTGAVLEPAHVLYALEQRFLKEGHPASLTLFCPTLVGDRPNDGGLNCIAHEGMVRKLIGVSFSATRHPRLLDLIRKGSIEGYIIAMGTAVQLLSAIAARKPGVYTAAGLGSFLDPRDEAGRMNEISRNPPVRLEARDGKEYLYYPAFPINVAIVRGTTADENGYVSMEEEPNTLAMLQLAAAAKASGGKVIAQVKRVARAGSLDPKLVKIPGPLVDMIVVDPDQHQLSSHVADPTLGWNPFLTGALKIPYDAIPPLNLNTRKLILRRAALELRDGDIVNLGAGLATDLPRIALEENVLDHVVFTNEHGIFGGLMASATGGSFVPAYNADAIMDSNFQFGYYDSGGLDITFLGVGQIDRFGNVNVSKYGTEWNGPGGFCNITEVTPRLVFCTTLCAGGLRTKVQDGRLNIAQEGRHHKFVEKVEQVTLNGARAYRKGQVVKYITERAVFELAADGIILTEIAPGVDLDRDIRPFVDFELKVSSALREIDARVYNSSAMDLSTALVRK